MKVAQRFSAGKPIHNMTESAKRTTERNGVIAGVFQPSASRTEKSTSVGPSAKALGLYLQASDRLRGSHHKFSTRRGRPWWAWFIETVEIARSPRRFFAEPEQLRGRWSPYPQAWVAEN